MNVQKLKWVVALGALLSTAGSFAYSDNPGTVLDKAVGKPEKKIKVVKYSPDSQVVCLDRMRTGTRIKKRDCRTVAAWKAQLKRERLQIHLLDM